MKKCSEEGHLHLSPTREIAGVEMYICQRCNAIVKADTETVRKATKDTQWTC